MKILALETSTENCSVVLWVDGTVFLREQNGGAQNSDLILPQLRDVLAEACCELNEVDAIAFGEGPGSFTGVRVACSVAQGLALGAGKPVVAVSTLMALAELCDANKVLVALDARMNEFYIAAYEKSAAGWQTIITPILCSKKNLPVLPGNDFIGIGSGFDVSPFLSEHYPAHIKNIIPNKLPSAAQIGSLGASAFLRGEFTTAENAQPLYLRNNVARTLIERGKLAA